MKFMPLWFLAYEKKQRNFCVFGLEPFFLGLLVGVFRFYFWIFGTDERKDLVCYCVLCVFKFEFVFGSRLVLYDIVLMFKSVIMFLCVLVQNELDLN